LLENNSLFNNKKIRPLKNYTKLLNFINSKTKSKTFLKKSKITYYNNNTYFNKLFFLDNKIKNNDNVLANNKTSSPLQNTLFKQNLSIKLFFLVNKFNFFKNEKLIFKEKKNIYYKLNNSPNKLIYKSQNFIEFFNKNHTDNPSLNNNIYTFFREKKSITNFFNKKIINTNNYSNFTLNAYSIYFLYKTLNC
jgi:hypothetical protein